VLPSKYPRLVNPVSWVKIARSKSGADWTIKQVLFKGHCKELLAEKQGLTIRLQNDRLINSTKGIWLI